MEDLIQKADVLLEALPYIQKFRSSIFVVKYGGSFMDSPDPEVRRSVAADIVFLEAAGINPIVVHGGGKAITRAMEREGIAPKFVQGMRTTDARSMRIVEDILENVINREIVEIIQQLGGRARQISGKKIFQCKKLLKDGIDLGFVGEVVDVKLGQVKHCLRGHIIPVISPIGLGDDGSAFNVNADLAAAKLAVAIGAWRLVFMSDVPGLLRDPGNSDSLISTLSKSAVQELKCKGVIDKGMIPKVDSATEAVEAGVHRVHFIDGRLPHSLLLEIFTDKGIGTEIVT